MKVMHDAIKYSRKNIDSRCCTLILMGLFPLQDQRFACLLFLSEV
jgi:hypothetical protein